MFTTGIVAIIALVAIIFFALTRRAEQKKIVLLLGLIVAFFLWFFSQTYTNMLYASAQKDASGNILWSYDLADRLQDAIALGFVSVVFIVIFLALIVYDVVRDAVRGVF